MNLPPIAPPDEAARAAAHARWTACAHPLGGLGVLETLLEEIAALTGRPKIFLTPRSVLVLCADNGVVAQGVTQTGSAVTGVVARGLARGSTSVCRMAAVAGCRVVPVDMGVKDFEATPGVLDRRIGNGTGDITRGPAMTRAQAERAIQTGIDLVAEEKERGTKLLATGEMGIGNTTTTSAVTAALLGLPPDSVTGRGAGLSDDGLRRKREAVAKALRVNAPDPSDPIDVLSKVGGFDLAGLCGVFLGGALHRVPILVDGAISAAAALCAVRLAPAAAQAVIATHLPAEPAGRLLLEALGKRPFLAAELRLGEGTGAVAAIPLLDMARAVYAEGGSFEDCGIPAYQPLGGKSCSRL